MKNAKFILSLGVVLAIATSVQVKGMYRNPNLTQEQRVAILEMQSKNNKQIDAIDEQISSLRDNAYLSTSQKYDRIYDLEDQKKVYNKKNKKINELASSGKTYQEIMSVISKI